MALSLRCLPYHQRWQLVPRPPITCTASPNILIATSCVNAVTDVFVGLYDMSPAALTNSVSFLVSLSLCSGTSTNPCERMPSFRYRNSTRC
jgi:hypothetical protein